MSIIQKLSEGIVNRDMKKEGQALLRKWEATGLLEGLDTEQSRQNMARLLENQAKELLRESSSMSAGDVEGFASVAFPIVRRVFAGLIANELVSVQPMSLPSGLIFFLDFVYSPDLGDGATQTSRSGNPAQKSIYGTNQVASQITGGVNIVEATNSENIGGLRQQVGYAYSAPTGSVLDGSIAAGAAACVVKNVIKLDGNLTEDQARLLRFDPDLINVASDDHVIVVDIARDEFKGQANFDQLSAFELSFNGDNNDIKTALDAVTGVSMTLASCTQVRRLAHHVKAGTAGGSAIYSGLTSQAAAVRFFIIDTGGTYVEGSSGTSNAVIDGDKIIGPLEDKITSTAEHALALTMSSLRNIPSSYERVLLGEWDYENFIGHKYYHNSLPNVYGITKIANNPKLAKNSLSKLQNSFD